MIGAEVARAVVLPDAGQGEAGNGVVEVDLEQKKAFVVPKGDIVFGAIFLDQLAFEKERLLDYLRHFILWETEEGLVKKIAGYHQFFAVRKAVDCPSSPRASCGRRLPDPPK